MSTYSNAHAKVIKWILNGIQPIYKFNVIYFLSCIYVKLFLHGWQMINTDCTGVVVQGVVEQKNWNCT